MLTVICLAIAVMAIVLGAMMYFQWRDIENIFKLKRPLTKGFADLVQASAIVDDGVIVNKNGSFTASWIFESSDNESATEEERDALSASLNMAFRNLGSGFALHIDSVRRVAPHYPDISESAFPDRVSYAIDMERRQLFESQGVLYEGMFVISLTWMPPLVNIQKASDFFVDKEKYIKDKFQETEKLISKFQEECRKFESNISGSFRLERLKTHKGIVDGKEVVFDDQLSFMHYCLTGLTHPIRLPKNPIYIDRLIGGQDVWPGLPTRIGKKYFRTISIDGFPSESYPGILNVLSSVPCECRWSTRYIFLDKLDAEKECDKFRASWKQSSRGFFTQIFGFAGGRINQDALIMADDAQVAKLEVQSDTVGLGYYTSVVVLYDEDPQKLEEVCEKVISKVIRDLGFTARIETVNNFEALLGSIPGHLDENVRRPLITTLNLADLIPSSTIWPGDEFCPNNLINKYVGKMAPALMHCVTQGVTPFRLNLHVGDLGHTVILGPTGAGKSVKLCALMAQSLRYPDMHIFAFDKGLSAYTLCKATGGAHYDIGAENSSLQFCPLQFLETVQDRAWAADWIESIIKINLPASENLTARDRNAIQAALENMSSNDNTSRSLTDFSQNVQSERVKEYLNFYTINGSVGYLLDASSDSLSFQNDGTKPFFTVFEIETLMGMGDRYLLPVLSYLFRRIEKSLKGQPAMIFLDEAWLMLSHPVFKEKIREWLKVLRKANCSVILATQSLDDLAKSDIADVLVESCPTKIFLPNPAINDKSKVLYESMGLNSRQIEIIKSARSKRDYYLVQGNHRRLYSLALGPLALAFTGVSSKEDLAKVRHMESAFKERWPEHWAMSQKIDLNRFTNGFVPPKPHAIKTTVFNEKEVSK